MEKGLGLLGVSTKDGETGIILVCKHADWVRFGREAGRWITCGRQSEAA